MHVEKCGKNGKNGDETVDIQSSEVELHESKVAIFVGAESKSVQLTSYSFIACFLLLKITAILASRLNPRVLRLQKVCSYVTKILTINWIKDLFITSLKYAGSYFLCSLLVASLQSIYSKETHNCTSKNCYFPH